MQIGWRPFDADRLKRPSLWLRILNIIYPIFIFCLLLFNYGYEVLLCPGQLNVISDTKVLFSYAVKIVFFSNLNISE